MDEETTNERAAQLVEDYLAYLEGVRRYSPHTVRAYRVDLEALVAWGDREGCDLLHVDHRDLRLFLNYLQRSGYEPKTVNRHLSSMRSFYRWLVHEGELASDPADALSSPKLPRRLPAVMSDSDMGRLLDTCDASDPVGLRDLALLSCIYATGARVSEMSGLDVLDFDLHSGQARLLGKGSKERIVPVYPEACQIVECYLSQSRPHLVAAGSAPTPALWISTRGRRMSADAIRVMLKRHLASAGLDLTLSPHAIRHTFATEVLSGGADLRSVQEMLGHVSLSTTQIYTHLSVDRLKSATRSAHPRG